MRAIFYLCFFLASITLNAQERKVNGKITDENNTPLSSVIITEQGTNNRALTDENGNFQIVTTTKNAILKVSYSGYINQDLDAKKSSTFKIQLTPKVKDIDEVVLIGYGEVKKSDLTGSVSQIKPTDDAKSAAQGIENLIQGKATGVVVNNTGFEPTAPINIKIRGVNSLSNGTQPLYVVDGIIVNSGDEREKDPLSGGNSYIAPQNGLMGINPRDIESMEILKDASATAIYGSRASNGVVIITTKKGKTGKPRFNYNTVTKVADITRNIEVLDGRGYAEYQNLSNQLKGFSAKFTFGANGEIYDANGTLLKEVNWSDLIYRTAISTSHRLSVSGGTEKSKYYFAAGYAESDGIIPNAFAKATDFSVNLSNQLNDNLKLDTKLAFTFNRNSASKGTENLGSTNGSMVRQIIASAPFYNYSDNNADNGNFDQITDGPLAWVQDYDDVSDEIRGLGSIALEYKISNVFKYRLLTGVDYRNKERKLWYGTSLFRGKQANGEAGISNFSRFRYNIDNTILFNKKFNENHALNGTLGFIVDQEQLKISTYQATDFPIKDLRADGISFANVISPLFYYRESNAIMSFIGRANYTFRNKYSLTGTFRADGSSKFAKSGRWGVFPAFALAWQLHKESFLDQYEKLSNLKLRAGWGVTGNQNTSPYQFFVTYINSNNPYPDSGSSSIGLIPNNIANNNLTWETTYQTNLGLDFGFINNRISGSVDFYNKDTKDLLTKLLLPGSSGGYPFLISNVGELQNRGFEASLSVDIIKNKNLKWNVYGNYSIYRNKITKYGMPAENWGTGMYAGYSGAQISGGNYFKTFANVFFEGYAAGMFWGYKTDGIINSADILASAPTINGVAPQLGDINVLDLNGDGVINEKDKTFIGDPNPDFTYGFGTNFEYKNFSLSLFFNGVYGNQIANGNLSREAIAEGQALNIRKNAFYDAWSTTNPNGKYPRVNYDLSDDLGFTDRMIEDGSFLRLQNVTLGYKVPLKKGYFIEGLDFSLIAYNVFLITNYTGFDPEVDSFALDNNRVGLDWQSFPNQKSYALGINITF